MAEEGHVIKVGILTISDSCSAGKAVDKSGENLKSLVEGGKYFKGSVIAKDIIPDEVQEIKTKLLYWSDQLKLDLILTTGGTGFSPRDVTPEATKAVIEKEAVGMVVALIKGSLDITPKAMLTRLVCGSRGSTLIINLPGSTKGSAECLAIASEGIPHAVHLLNDNLSEVEKTHRQMIKQGNVSKTVDDFAQLEEKMFQRVTDCSSQKFEGQGDSMGESSCLSQAYSMFKLIELLIRLAMPSIQHASAAYRILQSLSSSLSNIRNVTSMQETFDVWISALRSVMEASGNETEANSNFQYSASSIYGPCQDASSLKDQVHDKRSTFLLPSSSCCDTRVDSLQASDMTKLSQVCAQPKCSALGSNQLNCKEKVLTSETLNHHSATQNNQCLRSTLFHLPKHSVHPEPPRKMMQIKEAFDDESLRHNLFQNCIETKVNSKPDFSSTTFKSLHDINDHSSLKISLPCSEACVNFRGVHEIQNLKESLFSAKTLLCSTDSKISKLLNSQNIEYSKGEETMANLPHHKKLLMSCGWRKQEDQEQRSKCPLIDRETYQKSKVGKTSLQNGLNISSASDTCSAMREHSDAKVLRPKVTLPSYSCSGQGTASKNCQQSTLTSSSCNNVDRETSLPQGAKTNPLRFSFDVDRVTDCNNITSSNENHRESTSPFSYRAIDRQDNDTPSIKPIHVLDYDSANVKESRNHIKISVGSLERTTSDELTAYKEISCKRSKPTQDIAQSSQISSSEMDIKISPIGPAFKSAKIHNVRSRMHGELIYIPVGKAFIEFINEHQALKGVNLYKGKRDIKKLLVSLCRQENASSQTISWKRGKEVLERNRLDDYFQLTHEGMEEQIQVHCGKKRDQYVVNWYMWCPGHGNCQRKCGGYGQCLENCKGMLHKQDRHNCSLMVNLKLFLSDLSLWRVNITGSHIPKGNEVSSSFQGSKERAVVLKRMNAKRPVPDTATVTKEAETLADEETQTFEMLAPLLTVPSKPLFFDSETELASCKIPSKKRISRMLSNLKKRRKGRSYRSKANMSDSKPFPAKINSEASLFPRQFSNKKANNGESKNFCELKKVNCPFATNLCFNNNDVVKSKSHMTVDKIYSEDNVLQPANDDPMLDIETQCTMVNHSIVSTASFPSTAVTNDNSNSILHYNQSINSCINVPTVEDESVILTSETSKGENAKKEDGQEDAMKISFPYISTSNIEEDFQQPFLNANTLSDIFHHASSDLPQQLEDFIDVMTNSNWASASKHLDNPDPSSPSLAHALPQCHENPNVTRLCDAQRISCTSIVPNQILNESVVAAKNFNTPAVDVNQLTTQSSAETQNSPVVEAVSLFQGEFYNQERIATDVLPTYQEARAALGHQTLTEDNYI